MKSKFKIGDKVKDEDNDVGIVVAIYEREEAPNQILLRYSLLPDSIHYECDLERVVE